MNGGAVSPPPDQRDERAPLSHPCPLLLSADVDRHADDPHYLPIPEKDAYVILRLYGPSEAIQNGDYAPPVLEVLDESA